MKLLFKILAFVPLGLELILVLTALFNGADVVWTVHLGIVILLGIMSSSIISKKKSMHIVGIIALIIYLVLHLIMGYQDYIKWLSTIIGFVVFVYYAIVTILIRKIK